MQRDRTHLVTGPLYHNGPLTFSIYGLLLGNHLVLRSRFDALKTLQLIDKYKIDWLMLVPTMMLRISRLGKDVHQQYDLSSVRIVMHMAAPCPPWLKEEWINWFGPEAIHELFGATEGTGGTLISGTEWLTHRGSVGKPTATGKVKAVDKNGNDLPTGEIGELYWLPAGGTGSTYEYIGAQSTPTDDGWETQGDMGYIDEEGYVYLSDRKSDMILSGGANIYPAEVEAAIEAHPAVRTCAVIGLPDEDMGQLIHAIVDTAEEITAEELLEFLADQLVRYKIPRSIEFVDEPLRDEAGKVRRLALLNERTAKQ
jgi:bile acid-coenzyme A ligase